MSHKNSGWSPLPCDHKSRKTRIALIFSAPVTLALVFALNNCSSPTREFMMQFPPRETHYGAALIAIVSFVLGVAMMFFSLFHALRAKFGARSIRKSVMLAGVTGVMGGVYAVSSPVPFAGPAYNSAPEYLMTTAGGWPSRAPGAVSAPSAPPGTPGV